jgi:hypothetical protein
VAELYFEVGDVTGLCVGEDEVTLRFGEPGSEEGGRFERSFEVAEEAGGGGPLRLVNGYIAC